MTFTLKNLFYGGLRPFLFFAFSLYAGSFYFEAEVLPAEQVLTAALVLAFYYKWLYYIVETGLQEGRRDKLMALFVLMFLLLTMESVWESLVYHLLPLLGIYFDENMLRSDHYVFDRMKLRQSWMSALIMVSVPLGLRLAIRKNDEKKKERDILEQGLEVKKALSLREEENEAVYIALIRVADRQLLEVNCRQIISVSIDNHILTISFEDQREDEYYCSLRSFMRKVPADEFFQVHRSFAVQIACIRVRKGNILQLQNWKEVPVGDVYFKKLDALIERLKEKEAR